MRMDLVEVRKGTAVFRCQPDESHYNPIGAVHGGVMCTVLDSAPGCAAHSAQPAGMGYTSIEITVNHLRPVRADSGPLTCTGTVVKAGPPDGGTVARPAARPSRFGATRMAPLRRSAGWGHCSGGSVATRVGRLLSPAAAGRTRRAPWPPRRG
ncbi:PaaI family thioesterase [Cellulosimicrobium funkei]|nr:PaaI family thioesterase [Cellulosimicrobium funkei]